MKSLCLVVPRSEGEGVRKKLSEMGKLNLECRIRVEEDIIYLPVTEPVDMGYQVKDMEFEARAPRHRSYKDAVQGVPDGLIDLLPTSFDTIGDIAIVKVPDELLAYKTNIGEAMLASLPSVRLAAMDTGVEGETRVRTLVPIAGEGGLETIHREHNLAFELDISRCYFSPRLATERDRVAGLVRDGERILDMFAGVGPFALLIAKRKRVERLWAVDINPTAIDYLKRNIERNRVEGVEAVCGDARQVIKGIPPLDRVIMNLPHKGHEFLPDAIMACANDATIHYYEISKGTEGRAVQIEFMASRLGRGAEVMNVREVRSYSATESTFVYDIRVFVGSACAVPPSPAQAGKGPVAKRP